MTKPRTLYWAVKLENGQYHKGEKKGAVCTIDQYMGILKRKYGGMHHIKHVSVGINSSAQII